MPGKIFAVAGFAMALLAPAHLNAQFSGNYDFAPREIALLPAYCKYTQHFRDNVPGGNDLAKIKQWYSIMGGSYPTEGGFHAMHHYCRGLMHFNHANLFSRARKERMDRLFYTIEEIDYVLRNTPPGFALRPEFHTKKGEALIAMGKAPLAIAELRHAIQLKPDYWPPYVALSDYYRDTGNIKMARELLEQGLSSSPDATALKRRLAELDQVKGTPKTAPKTAAKPASEALK